MALSTFGFLVITSIPTVIGIAQAIDGQKRQNQQAKERVKFHLTARFSVDGVSVPEQGIVVFKDKKVSLVSHYCCYHCFSVSFNVCNLSHTDVCFSVLS